MIEFITTLGLGLLVLVLGIINMKGNISTLHWYHRHRVSDENKKPFGRLVGLGTLIIGLALIVFAFLLLLSEQTSCEVLVIIGTAELIVNIVVGIFISFYAMIKYNGGIF